MKWEDKGGGIVSVKLCGGAFALWLFPQWVTPTTDKAGWTLEDERGILASNAADDFDTAKRDVVSTAKRALTFLASLGAEPHRQRKLEQALKDLEALQ